MVLFRKKYAEIQLSKKTYCKMKELSEKLKFNSNIRNRNSLRILQNS